MCYFGVEVFVMVGSDEKCEFVCLFGVDYVFDLCSFVFVD